ncbi:MAG: 30S ribosomal protein S8 [Proteobacteria bacterium]|nr:30S ribosomal protein S8 [Pseudomonadota bacterium]
MTMTDPIADLLTRIRNGQRARKHAVMCPYSIEKEGLLKVLLDEGYIRHYQVENEKGVHKELKIELKYHENQPVIKSIDRVSKPGRRVYSPIAKLAKVANGLGISILSTNKGILSDAKARELTVGGEVLCRVF